MRSAVASLRAGRQNLLLAGAVVTLAEGLVGAGRFDEALAVVQEALADTHLLASVAGKGGGHAEADEHAAGDVTFPAQVMPFALDPSPSRAGDQCI